MKDTTIITFKEVVRIFRDSFGGILATHLTYVALGVVLFSPLTGVVGQFLLRLSGQSVLSDLDIAYFLLTPLGMASSILFVSLLIALLVFEQASLMVGQPAMLVTTA